MNVKVILFQNISKKFNNRVVLASINLKVEGGQVYCLLGRNGAGKSTLIHLACKIINPDIGKIIYDEDNTKPITGIQSQYDTLIDELNAFEYLEFIGRIYGMEKNDIKRQIEGLTTLFFEDKNDLKLDIKNVSLGTRKKIALCAAFLHRPMYLFLDEPFANLDSIASNSLCQLIRAHQSLNRCIIISSHDLLYVNKIATHLGILENGRLTYTGKLTDFESGLDLHDDLLKHFKYKKTDDEVLKLISE